MRVSESDDRPAIAGAWTVMSVSPGKELRRVPLPAQDGRPSSSVKEKLSSIMVPHSRASSKKFLHSMLFSKERLFLGAVVPRQSPSRGVSCLVRVPEGVQAFSSGSSCCLVAKFTELMPHKCADSLLLQLGEMLI